MVRVMRVAGDEEAMATATMVAGERWRCNEEGDGDGDKGG